MNNIELILIIIIICIVILICYKNNMKKTTFLHGTNEDLIDDIYIDNPYDLFNDSNYTTFVPCKNEDLIDDIYIDNPYDLFYDPNYTTLFYDPSVTYQLNKPDGYGGTWSLGGSKFYPYHHTYTSSCDPKRVISGNRITLFGGR